MDGDTTVSLDAAMIAAIREISDYFKRPKAPNERIFFLSDQQIVAMALRRFAGEIAHRGGDPVFDSNAMDAAEAMKPMDLAERFEAAQRRVERKPSDAETAADQ